MNRIMSVKAVGQSFIILLPIAAYLISCWRHSELTEINSAIKGYDDVPFVQEYHEAFFNGSGSSDNEVRSIISDRDDCVWIATASGIFRKTAGTAGWLPVITGEDRGPAYSVAVDRKGDVLMGTWNGLYRYSDGSVKREAGPEAPVSVICCNTGGEYALSPHGIWRYDYGRWEREDVSIARSIRDAYCDQAGNLWVATDAGLYQYSNGRINLFQDTSYLISCYARAVSSDDEGRIWACVLGGVSVLKGNARVKNMTPENGMPSAVVNCIARSPEGVMWVGTDVGVIRYFQDGSHSLRFSRRWLTDDRVLDIAFDKEGNAWIGTANGVSAIRKKFMTLQDKEDYFYDQLIRKHIREPWTAGALRLEVPGDTSTWHQSDDDNDGEYTGGYLAMESFRYAVTGDTTARLRAAKAFDFLRFLQEVTGTEGFFARSVIPADWKYMHDPNRTYDKRQLAEELVKDPRYKPVEKRWRLSKDGKWLWKGDTSSDEMDGHMMGYFYYYELAADENAKELIRRHVKKIMDCLISSGYNLIDTDGAHTRWSVWSPEELNHDPDWTSEKSLNSFELLAYLKFASHITGDERYENEYHRLINDEGYLQNASRINSKNPAWQIYFDRTLEGYIFPILLKYEDDPDLKKFYRNLADEWIGSQTAGENLINNFSYAFATGSMVNTDQSIEFLRDAPLDLVDWYIDHTLREDVRVVREPILEELQINELPPASIRSTVRWDKNPWAAVQGDPRQVREPVFWLWPYWMARYLGVINPVRP